MVETSSLPLAKHMVYPFLPFQKGTPLQVVRWAGDRVGTACGASSVELVLPSTSLVEIASTENCYINFKTGTGVTATSTIATDGSRLFMAGVQLVPVPLDPATGDPYTHMACIRAVTTGVLQVEAVE